MRAKYGLAVFCLGGWGCGGAPELEPSPLESQPSQVATLACSPEGARRVKVVVPPGTPQSPTFTPMPTGIRDVQGTAYFSVNLRDGSATLWKSQGTEASTAPVKAFSATSPGRNISSLSSLDSRFLFQVYTEEYGREPWITDGTEAGTQVLKDLTPGSAGSALSQFASYGTFVTFFRTWQVMDPPRLQVELWRTDGSAEGTTQLVNLGVLSTLSPSYVRTSSAHLFFLSSPEHGTALWRTNGTSGGTVFVKRLDANVVPVVDVGITEDGSTGLFTLRDGVNTEVWKSDGTASGTVRLESFGREMRMLGSLGAHVYLTNADPVTQRMGLYRVAQAGGGKATVTVLENPYADQEAAFPSLQSFTRSGGKLYFAVAISTPGPAYRVVKLWVTDGTATQTRSMPGSLSVSDEFSSSVHPIDGGGVIFAGADSAGSYTNPWVSYGTNATTAEVTATPSLVTSSPERFARVGGSIYFTAMDDTGWYQLWAAPANVSCTP
ncbi:MULTISPECIES: hypothetical protein [unclassified Myxococcus]|nr:MULTISPECIES: hypothetical protein [unclassified Myxococcus]NTX35511.1 hypothetical protein [Myxococcus sp. CA033]NTX55157.1 hypothetical protein [Myxococcus sp. CA039A]